MRKFSTGICLLGSLLAAGSATADGRGGPEQRLKEKVLALLTFVTAHPDNPEGVRVVQSGTNARDVMIVQATGTPLYGVVFFANAAKTTDVRTLVDYTGRWGVRTFDFYSNGRAARSR